MKLRILLVAAISASMVFGEVQLSHHLGVPSGAGAGVLAALLIMRAIGMVRSRARRLRRLPRAGETPVPTGSRRVLLLETGLAGPQ